MQGRYCDIKFMLNLKVKSYSKSSQNSKSSKSLERGRIKLAVAKIKRCP